MPRVDRVAAFPSGPRARHLAPPLGGGGLPEQRALRGGVEGAAGARVPGAGRERGAAVGAGRGAVLRGLPRGQAGQGAPLGRKDGRAEEKTRSPI